MSFGMWLLQSSFAQRKRTEEIIERLATKERGERRASSNKRTANSVESPAAPDREDLQANESCKERSVFHLVSSPASSALHSAERSVLS